MGWSKGVNWLNKALKAKQVEKAKKAEEQSKILEDYKRLKGTEEARFKKLSMDADKAWEDQRPIYIQDDISTFENSENAEDFSRYLIDRYRPHPVDFNAYRDALLSRDINKITTVFNNNYKKYFYDNYYKNNANSLDYKKYYKPTSETPNTEPLNAPLKNEPIRDETLTDVHLKNEIPKPEAPNNTTEAVTPKAETVNTIAKATTEVPKDPSNVGLFLKKALTSANADGAIYGGAIGYQYPDEDASETTRLMSALSGALVGGYGVGLAGKSLKALKKPKLPSIGSILKKENVLSLGRKLPAVPIMFWDETKDYFKPTASKPEDASPPLGTPVNTYQQNTPRYTEIK